MQAALPRRLAATLGVLAGFAHYATHAHHPGGAHVAPGLGWDESMHLAQPAARLALHLQQADFGGFFDALLDCAQYPPLAPLATGLFEGFFGVSEELARSLGSLWLALAVFGAIRAGELLAGWRAGLVAGAVVALSPLASSYAGTLFLEVPFLAACTWALARVLAHQPHNDPQAPWFLPTGLLVAALPFTKWNYGLLAAGALWLALLAKERHGSSFGRARRLALLFGPGLFLMAWWFVLPLPEGAERAREHREALLGFLGGNTGLAATPWTLRALYAGCELFARPSSAVCALVLVLLALGAKGGAPCWWLAAALVPTIAAHPFHLDRFQLAWLAPLAPLAGAGFEAAWSRGRWASLALLLPFVLPGAAWERGRLAQSLGLVSSDPAVREHQLATLESRANRWSGRVAPTAGLPLEQQRQVAAAIAAAAGADARIGWIGVSSELSPGALNLLLLDEGRSDERFLAAAQETIDLDYYGAAREVGDEELRRHCERFDVIAWSEPIDVKERADRAWLAPVAARVPALLPGAWLGEDGVLARFEVERPLRPPTSVTIRGWRLQR